MRLKSIILTDLVNNQLKTQEKLERVMNGNGKVDEECVAIKAYLRELVILERMIEKWQQITPIEENKLIEENNNKNKKDG